MPPQNTRSRLDRYQGEGGGGARYPLGHAHVGQGYYDVGGNGMLVYVPGQPAVLERRLVWVDRDSNAERVIEATARYAYPRISPDGQRVAVMESAAGLGDIFLVDVHRGTRSRVTTGSRDVMPIWAPDGERIVFASTRHGGPADLFVTPVDVEGAAEVLYPSADATWPRSWSPDGRWIAYVSNVSGRDDVYVQPFPEGDHQYPVSTEGGAEPTWSRDGGELYYRLGDRMMAVLIDSSDGFRPGNPMLLFTGHFATDDISGNQYYDVDPVSRRFLMVSQEDETAPTQFNVVLHWFGELARRVPTTISR